MPSCYVAPKFNASLFILETKGRNAIGGIVEKKTTAEIKHYVLIMQVGYATLVLPCNCFTTWQYVNQSQLSEKFVCHVQLGAFILLHTSLEGEQVLILQHCTAL